MSKNSKIAIVTGGARRIGRAFALQAAVQGYDVALHYNSSIAEAKEAAAEIESKGVRCALIEKNLSDFNAVQALIPEVKQKLGAPTLLINNASPFEPNKLATTEPEKFDRDFLVHVKAPYFLMQAFAADGAKGHVINIVDGAVMRFATDYFTYLLSKKTLLELTKRAARELAPAVRVNAIAPGIILKAEGWDDPTFELMARQNPLMRHGTVDDLVMALDYLMRNEQVTGECLYVDGGGCIDY